MSNLFILLAIILLVATASPMLRVSWRWVRFFDFPRLQIAFLLLATMCFGWVLWALGAWAGQAWVFWGMQAALLAGLIYQTWWIWPYTSLARREVMRLTSPDNSRRIRLLIYNVRMSNRSYQPFLDRVRKVDPDMILATEVDQGWITALAELSPSYTYQVLAPLDNTYGMALYSRLPLADGQVRYTVQEDIPSIHARVRLHNGEEVDFYGIHPRPPDLQTDTAARDAELVRTGIEVRQAARPALIAGDLNDVAWSYTSRLFKRLSQTLDPRIGRGFYNTYSVHTPGLRYPLDHLFITPHFRLVRLQRLPACGSDHFPMVVELSYEPAHAPAQPTEKIDAADVEHTQDILEEDA